MKAYSYQEILETLDYRPPMALLDSALENGDGKWSGMKNISFNEVVFNGHFPGHPIMPGVMQIEAMEQLAELALKNSMNPGKDRLLLAKKMKKIKFRKPALPGDRMIFDLEIKNVSGEEGEVSITCKTKSGLVSQAEITMGMFPKKREIVLETTPISSDKNNEIVMDVNQIMSVIPHRYPFLFVDYITQMSPVKILAVKNVSGSEPFCGTHSASSATVPVPFLSEIVAQAGCVLTLSKPANKGKIAYFMAIDEAECFEPARPGDQLIIDVDVPEGSSKFGKGEGRIMVGDKLISRTVMMFAVVDK
ncbi:MAG TPA: hypothetical protein PK821_01650 [Victivallales bacterium]|nr:hypothetical protein [Victivallales bacterium]